MSEGEHTIYTLTRRIEARQSGETTGWGETHSMELVLGQAVRWLSENDNLIEIDKEHPFLTEDDRREIEQVRALIKEAKELYEL
jgi:hypothetical protein